MKHSPSPASTTRRVVLGSLLALGMGASAHADQVYRIVVPFGPGAVQDTIARTFNNELGKELGATVIIENKAGAGGSVGTGQVAKSTPDGTTLVMAAASQHLSGYLYDKLPYHPNKDFVGVSYIGLTGYVVGVPTVSGITSIKDLIDRAQKAPETLFYASAGNGSASHLSTASLAAKAGVKLQHVPTKSTGDAITEMISGRVQVVTGASIGMLAFEKDPRVKLLAYTGKERSRFLPNLPTAAEAGVPGYAFDSWLGLLAPAATPKETVERINNAMIKVLAQPAVQERLARVGVEPGTMAPAEFQKLLNKDWVDAEQIVKSANIRIE